MLFRSLIICVRSHIFIPAIFHYPERKQNKCRIDQWQSDLSDEAGNSRKGGTKPDREMDEKIEKKSRYSVKTSSRGGARPNSGRKKGQPNKISAATILEQVQIQLGIPFEEQLVQNYMNCLSNQDLNMIHQYDKLFLSKVVADKVEVDVIQSEELIQAKKEAFTEALLAMTTISTRNK